MARVFGGAYIAGLRIGEADIAGCLGYWRGKHNWVVRPFGEANMLTLLVGWAIWGG